MANDNNHTPHDQDNDGSPSNEQQQQLHKPDTITPTSKQSFSEQFPQNDHQPSISDLRQHHPSMSIGTEPSNHSEKQCWVCKKKFGAFFFSNKFCDFAYFYCIETGIQ